MCFPERMWAVAAWLCFDSCLEKWKQSLTKQLHQTVSSTKLRDSGLICFQLVQKTQSCKERPHYTALLVNWLSNACALVLKMWKWVRQISFCGRIYMLIARAGKSLVSLSNSVIGKNISTGFKLLWAHMFLCWDRRQRQENTWKLTRKLAWSTQLQATKDPVQSRGKQLDCRLSWSPNEHYVIHMPAFTHMSEHAHTHIYPSYVHLTLRFFKR